MILMSLNTIFWIIIITILYIAILVGCIKDMRKRGFKSEDKGTLVGLTFFYIAVIVSILFIYPEGWI
jgi:hypothetical protein